MFGDSLIHMHMLEHNISILHFCLYFSLIQLSVTWQTNPAYNNCVILHYIMIYVVFSAFPTVY